MNTSQFINRLRFTLLGGALFAILTGLARGATEDRIEKTFTMADGDKLVVEVDRGAISVRTIAGSTLTLTAVRTVQTKDSARAEEILKRHEIEFTQEGREVRLRARFNGRNLPGKEPGFQVSYQVTTPKKVNLQLNSKAGGIVVKDVEGSVDARTGAGALDFEGVAGPIVARTSGGGIRARACGGAADLETSAGQIDVNQAVGDVRAKTSGGGIHAVKVQGNLLADTAAGAIDIVEAGGKVDARTRGGGVKASFAKNPGGPCILKTSAGSIQVRLPHDATVDLDARTSAGQVSTDFEVAAANKHGRGSIQAKLNGGGPEFVAQTAGGSVHIGKR